MIPKICHSVWLGNPMPEREKTFLVNNKKVLKDYIFNLWDNETYSSLIKNHPIEDFIKRAIDDKKWAFASDAIKLVALEKFGGWSIDADNEILKPFDDFLSHRWVTGFEIYSNRLKPVTAVWGAIPNHSFTKILLSKYSTDDYSYLTTKANTKWISRILFSYNVLNNNEFQYCKDLDVTLYPSHVFCGPRVEGSETYSIHHFNGSWL